MCASPGPTLQLPQSPTACFLSPPPGSWYVLSISADDFPLLKSVQHTEPQSSVFCVCLLWISVMVLWLDSSKLGELLVRSVLFLNDPTVRTHHNLLIYLLNRYWSYAQFGLFWKPLWTQYRSVCGHRMDLYYIKFLRCACIMKIFRNPVVLGLFLLR